MPVTPVLLQGREVADSLCEAASRTGTDLVVMATHGRGPLGRLWCGSVADVLMRRLSVPMLFVPGYDSAGRPDRRPAHAARPGPAGGSAFAEQVLGPALAWAP